MFPQLVPDEFAELLGALHFAAPPMHFSLEREHLAGEFGGAPERSAGRPKEAYFPGRPAPVHRERIRDARNAIGRGAGGAPVDFELLPGPEVRPVAALTLNPSRPVRIKLRSELRRHGQCGAKKGSKCRDGSYCGGNR